MEKDKRELLDDAEWGPNPKINPDHAGRTGVGDPEGETEEIITWNEFTQNTTFHGLKYIFDEKPFGLRRAAWFISVMIAVALFAAWGGMRVSDYLAFSSNVNVEVVYTSKLNFPAVTICNLNNYRLSKAIQWNLYHYINDYFKDPDGNFSNYDNFSHIDTKAFLLDAAHSSEDLIDNCKWNRKQCKPNAFETKLTDIGVCYTFNGNVLHPEESSTPGSGYGLHLVLNVEQYEYMRGPQDDIGVKILLHNSTEFPRIRDQGFVLEPGKHFLVTIDREEIITLEKPYGYCVKSAIPKPDCELAIETNYTLKACNCTDIYMNSSEICDVKKMFQCVQYNLNNRKESGSATINECHVPCERTVYGPRIYSALLSKYNMDRVALTDERRKVMTKSRFLQARDLSQRAIDSIRIKDNEIIDMTKKAKRKFSKLLQEYSRLFKEMSELSEFQGLPNVFLPEIRKNLTDTEVIENHLVSERTSYYDSLRDAPGLYQVHALLRQIEDYVSNQKILDDIDNCVQDLSVSSGETLMSKCENGQDVSQSVDGVEIKRDLGKRSDSTVKEASVQPQSDDGNDKQEISNNSRAFRDKMDDDIYDEDGPSHIKKTTRRLSEESRSDRLKMGGDIDEGRGMNNKKKNPKSSQRFTTSWAGPLGKNLRYRYPEHEDATGSSNILYIISLLSQNDFTSLLVDEKRNLLSSTSSVRYNRQKPPPPGPPPSDGQNESYKSYSSKPPQSSNSFFFRRPTQKPPPRTTPLDSHLSYRPYNPFSNAYQPYSSFSPDYSSSVSNHPPQSFMQSGYYQHPYQYSQHPSFSSDESSYNAYNSYMYSNSYVSPYGSAPYPGDLSYYSSIYTSSYWSYWYSSSYQYSYHYSGYPSFTNDYPSYPSYQSFMYSNPYHYPYQHSPYPNYSSFSYYYSYYQSYDSSIPVGSSDHYFSSADMSFSFDDYSSDYSFLNSSPLKSYTSPADLSFPMYSSRPTTPVPTSSTVNPNQSSSSAITSSLSDIQSYSSHISDKPYSSLLTVKPTSSFPPTTLSSGIDSTPITDLTTGTSYTSFASTTPTNSYDTATCPTFYVPTTEVPTVAKIDPSCITVQTMGSSYNLVYYNSDYDLDYEDEDYESDVCPDGFCYDESESGSGGSGGGSTEEDLSWAESVETPSHETPMVTAKPGLSGHCATKKSILCEMIKELSSRYDKQKYDKLAGFHNWYTESIKDIYWDEASTKEISNYILHKNCLSELKKLDGVMPFLGEVFNQSTYIVSAIEPKELVNGLRQLVKTVEKSTGPFNIIPDIDLSKCSWFKKYWKPNAKTQRSQAQLDIEKQAREIEQVDNILPTSQSFQRITGFLSLIDKSFKSITQSNLQLLFDYKSELINKSELYRSYNQEKVDKSLAGIESNMEEIKAFTRSMTNDLDSSNAKLQKAFLSLVNLATPLITPDNLESLPLMSVFRNSSSPLIKQTLGGIEMNLKRNMSLLFANTFNQIRAVLNKCKTDLPEALSQLSKATLSVKIGLEEFQQDNNMDTKFYLDNFIRVDLYYPEFSYQRIVQQEAFTWVSLLSEIGGFMGLLLGASILTVCEIVDYIVLLCLDARKKRQIVTPVGKSP